MAMIDAGRVPLTGPLAAAVKNADALFCSVASFWEVAIKHRLGRLPLPCPLLDTPNAARAVGIDLIDIAVEQALVDVEPWPDTNDPFDRLLLAVWKLHDLRLITIDRKLADHPLAWRPAA